MPPHSLGRDPPTLCLVLQLLLQRADAAPAAEPSHLSSQLTTPTPAWRAARNGRRRARCALSGPEACRAERTAGSARPRSGREIGAAIHHEHRNADARAEVERIRLRQRPLELEAAHYEHRHLDPRFEADHQPAEARAPAAGEVCDSPRPRSPSETAPRRESPTARRTPSASCSRDCASTRGRSTLMATFRWCFRSRAR